MSGRLGLPPDGGTAREQADVLRQLAQGRSLAAGEVTLRTGQSTTTFDHPFLAEDSVVLLSPLTLSAAQELPNVWISAQANRSVTISHPSSGVADRRYRVGWIG